MVKNLFFTQDTHFISTTFASFVLDYPNLGDWITYLPDQAWVDLFILTPSPVVVIALLGILFNFIITFSSFFSNKEKDLGVEDEEFWQDFDPDPNSDVELGFDEKENEEVGPVPSSEPEDLASSTGEDVIVDAPVEGGLIVDVELEPKNSGEILVDAITELAEWLIGKARELLGLVPEVAKILQENIFPVIKAFVKEVFKYTMVGLAMVCWTLLVKFAFFLYINHLSGWCCFMEDSIQSGWCDFLKHGVAQNFNDLITYVLGKKKARYAACYLQLFLFRSNFVVALLILALFKWF